MIHTVFCCFENLMHCMALCSLIFNWQFVKQQATNGGHQRTATPTRCSVSSIGKVLVEKVYKMSVRYARIK